MPRDACLLSLLLVLSSVVPAKPFLAPLSLLNHDFALKYTGNVSVRSTKEDAEESTNTPPPMDPAKRAALDGVLNKIERAYGRGSIVKLGEADSMVVASIGSGSLALDAALGGGYPKGRVVEIYGPESSGKTTLALHAIAESQALGGTAAFVDAEHALDPSYAADLGVDIDNLLVSQPDS